MSYFISTCLFILVAEITVLIFMMQKLTKQSNSSHQDLTKMINDLEAGYVSKIEEHSEEFKQFGHELTKIQRSETSAIHDKINEFRKRFGNSQENTSFQISNNKQEIDKLEEKLNKANEIVKLVAKNPAKARRHLSGDDSGI